MGKIELQQELPGSVPEKYRVQLDIYNEGLLQKRRDTNKIYSLHKPELKWYAERKKHKKFEF